MNLMLESMRAGWTAYEQTLFLNDRDLYEILSAQENKIKTCHTLFSAVLLFDVYTV